MIGDRRTGGNGRAAQLPGLDRLGCAILIGMEPRSGALAARTLVLALALAGCAGGDRDPGSIAPAQARRREQRLETKPWHVSAGWHDSDYSSTSYPEVEWSVIEQLQPGMSAARARELLGDLQSYHHPVNAIAFARNPAEGRRYEIALRLSADGTRIEDLSFKHVERTPTGDFWPEPRER
jgi:hypothetical protein